MSGSAESWEKLLITIYQEVNDLVWSKSCCDDENLRTGDNTGLPEQPFNNSKWKKNENFLFCTFERGGLV
jgi:hypothetical protein